MHYYQLLCINHTHTSYHIIWFLGQSYKVDKTLLKCYFPKCFYHRSYPLCTEKPTTIHSLKLNIKINILGIGTVTQTQKIPFLDYA